MDELRKIPCVVSLSEASCSCLKRTSPVTRTVSLGTAAVSLSVILQLISPYAYLLSWPMITQRLQLWRLLTPFLLGSSGINLLFDLFLLYRHTNELEGQHYYGRTADMAWAVAVMSALMLALAKPLKLMVLNRSLIFAIVHLWSQCFAEQRVNLYGFVTIKGRFFSGALLALDVLMGGPAAGITGLVGIISAQAWYYLSEIYPRGNGGRPLPGLATPQLLIRYLGNGAGQPAGGAPPTRGTGTRMGGGTAYGPTRGQRVAGSGSTTATQTTTGHSWGSGNRLGEQ